jgi:hypothetical protein
MGFRIRSWDKSACHFEAGMEEKDGSSYNAVSVAAVAAAFFEVSLIYRNVFPARLSSEMTPADQLGIFLS